MSNSARMTYGRFSDGLANGHLVASKMGFLSVVSLLKIAPFCMPSLEVSNRSLCLEWVELVSLSDPLTMKGFGTELE